MKLIYFFNEEWEKEYISAKMSGWEIEFLEGSIQKHADHRDDNVEAIAVFDRREFKKAIDEAVKACMEKSKKLTK